MKKFQEMKNWIDYLKIDDKYSDDIKKKKCILFIFLWMQYNEFYNIKYSTIKSDREKALKIAEDFEVQTIYEELKGVFLSKFKVLGESNVYIRESIYNYYLNREESFTDENNSIAKFLEIIYTIRGNFFRGNKPPMSENVDIIAWAYDCFFELLHKSKIIY